MAVKNTTDLLNEQLGKKGTTRIIDTTAVTSVDFYAVQFVTESVISALQVANLDASSANPSVLYTTIPAGTVLFMNITGITLTSGVAIGYNN
tara:strand:- start:635 stop:910 length:276 start_codon:yes stop_codon:yes gene_type:complete